MQEIITRIMKQVVIFIVMLFICSCTLFKKTSRTSDVTTKSSLNQLESSQLVLKNIGKETQVFTYWNDSGFYQYQLVKESSKESSATRLRNKEILDSKEKKVERKSEPVKGWVYVSILLAFIVSFVLYRKFRVRSTN